MTYKKLVFRFKSLYLKMFLNQMKIFCFSATSNEHTHCYLRTSHFQMNKLHFVASTSTDGSIIIWCVNGTCDQYATTECHKSDTSCLQSLTTPVLKKQIHGSGINALAIQNSKNLSHSFLIATGGDDNSLCVMLCQVNDNKIHIITESCVENAHATQITGLEIIEDTETSSRFSLISCSIDQRVTKWNIEIILNKINIIFINSIFTNIADISSMNALARTEHSNSVLVCGQGLSVVSIN